MSSSDNNNNSKKTGERGKCGICIHYVHNSYSLSKYRCNLKPYPYESISHEAECDVEKPDGKYGFTAHQKNPTAYLRYGTIVMGTLLLNKENILQQWWGDNHGNGEWRPVISVTDPTDQAPPKKTDKEEE